MTKRCAQCLAPTPADARAACSFCGAALADQDGKPAELLYEDDRLRVSAAFVTSVREARVIAIARVRAAALRQRRDPIPGCVGFVAAFVAWAGLWSYGPDSPWITLAPIALVVGGLLVSALRPPRTADLVVETNEGDVVVARGLPSAKAIEAQAAVRRAMEQRAVA